LSTILKIKEVKNLGTQSVWDMEMPDEPNFCLPTRNKEEVIVAHNCAAHSTSYAFLTYRTSWLKTYYPVEFMAAALTCDASNEDQLIIYLQECKQMGIPVLPPDVNESGLNFTPSNGTIRFGLSAIKNIGEGANLIINERNKNGPFTDFFEFVYRIDSSKLHKKKLDTLTLSGAFDSFRKTRATLLSASEQVLEQKELNKGYIRKVETYENKLVAIAKREEEIAAGVLSDKGKPLKPLKPISKPELPPPLKYFDFEELPLSQLLLHEKELTGFFISGHPLQGVRSSASHTLKSLKEDLDRPELVTILAIISNITIKETKTKQRMAYIKIEDLTGTIEATLFPRIYQNNISHLIENVPVLIKARVEYSDIETEDGELIAIPSLLVQDIKFAVNRDTGPSEVDVEVPLTFASLKKILKLTKNQEDTNAPVRLNFKTQNNDIFHPSNTIQVNNERTFRRKLAE
jgi:DNA polymerase-3 subunit alpha